MVEQRIRNTDDLLDILDELLDGTDDTRWNRFFADRTKACPFFVDWPDESLVHDFAKETIRFGRALELGCGNGRNAIYMASRGCSVDAIDFSESALAWAKDRTHAAGEDVHYILGSIFDVAFVPTSYDIVYDSGCFHHVAPHRREAYVNLVSTALKPGGVLSIVCFRPEGGSDLTDLQVYEQRSLRGGLGFSEQALWRIFESHFEVVEIRRMHEMPPSEKLFGKDFLWAVRMRKTISSTATSFV